MGNIIVDSSALLSILLLEHDHREMEAVLEKADTIYVSAVGYMEVGIVLDNRPATAHKQHELDDLIANSRIEVMPADKNQAIDARRVYRRFGKGKHPAKLNMGDCFAYALAKQLDVPLLYKGTDFDKTDVKSAL